MKKMTGSSRWWVAIAAVCVLLGFGPNLLAGGSSAHRTPVILDTDIGDDIDDTWALELVLQSPELDLKLVVGDYGRPVYRARLLAKLLERAGRTDVPVGLGVEFEKVGGQMSQAAWLGDYDLAKYPGKVHLNGVRAMVDLIMKSREPVTVLAIGPMPNLAAALVLEPRIAQKAVFVGMHGSVRVGYGGSTNVAAEWNVVAAPKAAQAVFAASWKKTITPLDTCGLVGLKGDYHRRVVESNQRAAVDVVANYRVWAACHPEMKAGDVDVKSSTLFDCVAVYLAVNQDLCVMEDLNLRVTDDGFTRIDPAGSPCRVATAWKDLPGFEKWIADRLTRPR
jgi:inosine-uridine nucleoside N-ribohydrolase